MDPAMENRHLASTRWAGRGVGRERSAAEESIRRAARQAVIGVAIVGLVFIAGAVTAFRLEFGVFPPSRVNLIWWIDPTDPNCDQSQLTYHAEDVPFIGTGVGISDICFDAFR